MTQALSYPMCPVPSCNITVQCQNVPKRELTLVPLIPSNVSQMLILESNLCLNMAYVLVLCVVVVVVVVVVVPRHIMFLICRGLG